ncbi:MAG: hypothetical protein Q7K55_06805 [Candidatus Levybacteria bacterium]|nr:hypothetical protein [Candidatus Levybacteria bacterium]
MSETNFVLQENDAEKISLNKGPFVLTESGIKFTPEFERKVQVDSVVLDWQNTVEKVTAFGETHHFEGAKFKPTISLLRVFGLERKRNDPTQDRLVNLLSSEDPRILLIHGHGKQKGSKWLLSAKGFGEELVDIEDFLKGPIKQQVSNKPYDLVVIDACSASASGVGTYEIPQEVVDRVGVPIYYIQGTSSVLVKAERKLAEPTIKSN